MNYHWLNYHHPNTLTHNLPKTTIYLVSWVPNYAGYQLWLAKQYPCSANHWPILVLSLTDYEYFQNVLADIVTISLVGKEIGFGRSVVEKKVSEEEIGGDMGVQCVYGGSDKC